MSDPGASPERESSPTSEPERTRPSSASSTSTASGETERGQPTPIASSSTLTPSTDKQNDDSREADLSVTPTTSSNVQNPTTPPASSRPVAALSTASPAPTSSPTPNAHRRNHSAASASTSSSTGHPTSAFSSPARREQTSQHQHGGIGGDVNDGVLHEESAEEEERHVGDGSGYFGSVQSTPATQASSRSRQGTYAAVTSSTSRSRPPSAALNRRSISVNTQASTGSNPQSGPSNRRSAHHLSAPSSQQPLRTPTSHPLQGSASARPASRLDRPLTAMSGYEREYGSADEESADEDLVEREKERRRRAMSPAVGGRRRNGDDNEDDEVIPLDRGEQLVKRRARERKEKRRQANADLARVEQQQRRISSAVSTPGPDQTAFSQQQTDHPPYNYASYPFNDSLGIGYPAQNSGPRLRDPSAARSERSQAYSVFSDGTPVVSAGPRSPQTYWSPMPLPLPATGGRPGLGTRGSSYVSSSGVSNASAATSAIGREDEERSIVEGAEPQSEEDGEEPAGNQDEVESTSQDPRVEDWRDGGGDGEHSGDDEDDGEVEYTLKDRQDAINVEHPFGLPIWKPALYKKSRSIARHADEALHSAPSSTALHHLLPANIAWTLFAGVWLSIVCIIVGTVLWLVPWGGSKYGRVIWELGGYLFWPFGKYVEGWGEEQIAEEAHGKNLDDEEENENETNEDGNESGMTYRNDDPEAQGTTYRRGRSGTINASSAGSAPSNRSRPALDGLFSDIANLPDEPRRQPSNNSLRPPPSNERAQLVSARSKPSTYGSTSNNSPDDKARRTPSDDTIVGSGSPRTHTRRSASGASVNTQKSLSFRPRALGRLAYWTVFYLLVAPLMLFVCIFCWAVVFYIPMAKLLWVLLCHLNNEPLSLHFRSPPAYATPQSSDEQEDHDGDEDEEEEEEDQSTATEQQASEQTQSNDENGQASAQALPQWPLEAGQLAPRVSRKKVADAKRRGRIISPRSTVLLCTYKAAGLEYYKYTLDGVNIWFVNLMSLVFFVIFDFFILGPYAVKHDSGGFLKIITGQAFMFFTALLGVIPLSYFIGMAVASISAQSSIGTGAFINASFGSAIEILLYSIALTQSKGELVEGSIVGSILAGVLLMPGLSMIGGAFKRKEQRFNARSAGVTSMMLIVAVIGVFTPTLFYEIYGSFQLTCSDCDVTAGLSSCRTCYYEHIDPADDPFYLSTVQYLSYFCGSLLVLSYAVGIWFSLRTHASQIWQNAAPAIHEQGLGRPAGASQPALEHRRSIYQRVVPSQLFQPNKRRVSGSHTASGVTPLQTPFLAAPPTGNGGGLSPAKVDFANIETPNGFTPEQFRSVVRAVADAAPGIVPVLPQSLRRAPSHAREVSEQNKEEDDGGHGGHDAPNWSRKKSTTVLLGCTLLYAIIAEILVDVVDVILEGSGIPEKLLGVTLFALVPNTTEFMNAISFALNGNIALSMEIGSAYALQVCLIQAPAMLAFTAFYGIGKESMLHRAFTLVFPRWDIIAILFSVFLLTYVYIEARSNYFRGVLLCLSYCLLIAGFAFAPKDRDTSDNPGFGLLSSSSPASPYDLSFSENVQAIVLSLFTK